jgi:ribosomal protein S18 acetylase RimI-like enzyme
VLDDRTALARLLRFREAAGRRQSTDIVATPVGFALLNSTYHYSYDHNKFLLTGPLDSARRLDEIVDVLDAAGCANHTVIVHDETLGRAAEPLLSAAGFGWQRNVHMRHRGAVEHAAPAVAVTEIPLAEMQDFDRASWRQDLPDATPQVVEQLAARRETRLAIAPEVVFLGVRGADGTVVAHTDLYLDRESGIAQIEDVLTAPEHRGRGYARALLAEALRRADGCDLVFLEADLDDWPRHFYAKLGFTDLALTYTFSRALPQAATPDPST